MKTKKVYIVTTYDDSTETTYLEEAFFTEEEAEKCKKYYEQNCYSRIFEVDVKDRWEEPEGGGDEYRS